MIFGLSLVPVTIGAGVGLDMSRSMVVRARLTEALDAAGLAVGGTAGLTTAQMQSLAQKYFNANYKVDTTYGTPAAVSLSKSGQVITLTTNVPMPTTLMKIAGISTMTVHATSQITYGQTKLWVALVLDNTGSMGEADSTGLTKISSLKTATNQLLTMLQGAATNAGDVKVSIVPFSKDVNVGTSNVNAAWIDWTDWEAAPANGTPSSTDGPGTACPYTTGTKGYKCASTPTNGATTTATIPSSGTYSGYICPGIDNGAFNSGRLNHYWNGCYNSVATTTVVTGSVTTTQPCINSSSCTTATYCSGYPTTSSSTSGNTTTVTTTTCQCVTTSGSKKTCTRTATPVATTVGAPYTHTWIKNAHSTWGGCVMDRTQSYDVSNTAPSSSATYYPAENSSVCVPSVMQGTLGYNWTSLAATVTAMTAGGTTNQPVGLAWGWQTLTNTAPFSPGSLPQDTQKVIIILSDGLNTQDRWYGDGSNQATGVDARMSLVCAAAKADGATVYSVFVDLAGTSGNSAVMQSCATDSSKYFDLTTSASISTAFATIGQQITNLRVSQ